MFKFLAIIFIFILIFYVIFVLFIRGLKKFLSRYISNSVFSQQQRQEQEKQANVIYDDNDVVVMKGDADSKKKTNIDDMEF